jgi:site-specific DNA-methyltransferase (adenine-specific)
MFVFSKGKPKTFNPIQKKKIEHRAWKTCFRKPDWSKVHKILIENLRETKDASNVWSYPSGNKTIDHPAVFPEQLAEDHILSWSNEWDIILDPFAWSWTTLKMAKKNNRDYLGIEISEEYIEIINNRICSFQN